MRNRMGSSFNLDTTVVGLQGHPISTTAPISGQALVFNGTDWTPTTVQTSGGAIVPVNDVLPSNPVVGELYWDLNTAKLFLWDGTQWIATINTPEGSGGSSGPPFNGVTDGSNAAPGQIGEYILAVVNGVTVTSEGANDTLATLALTAGDWDVAGQATITPTTGPLNGVTGVNIQITGLPLPWTSNTNFVQSFFQPNGLLVAQGGVCVPSFRVNLSAPATANIAVGFGSTVATAGLIARADGYFGARRMR